MRNTPQPALSVPKLGDTIPFMQPVARGIPSQLLHWALVSAIAIECVIAQAPTPAQTIAPDVQRLLWLDSRDAALGRILERGIYRGPGEYKESDRTLTVRQVVICPQLSGPPLFAVFVRSHALEADGLHVIDSNTEASLFKGHLIQIAADGAIVRCYLGNNRVDAAFADINGDQVIDRVETMRCSSIDDQEAHVTELFVVPVTEEAAPTLRIAFDAGEPRDRSTWRVVPASNTAPARIELGPRDPATGGLKSVTATWSWDRKLRGWTGPGGGPGQSFMRLPPAGHRELKEFAHRPQQPKDH